MSEFKFSVGAKAAPAVTDWVSAAIGEAAEVPSPFWSRKAKVTVELVGGPTIEFAAVLSSARFENKTFEPAGGEGRPLVVGMLCELEFDQLWPAAKVEAHG